jgi:hypothetical protein
MDSLRSLQLVFPMDDLVHTQFGQVSIYIGRQLRDCVIGPLFGNRRSKMSVTFILEQFILNEQSDVDLHLAVLVISGIGL